jgi:hypothetical protein
VPGTRGVECRRAIGRTMAVVALVAVVAVGGLAIALLGTQGGSPSTASQSSTGGPTGSTTGATSTSGGTTFSARTTSSLGTMSSASTSTTTETTVQYNLSAQPLVWFSPLPKMGVTSFRSYTGSLDFMDLFNTTAPWSQAASHVQVFKLYAEWIGNYATPQQLAKAVGGLNQRGIAIAVEAPPLVPTSTCGNGVEGFWGANQIIPLLQKVVQAGGRLTYIAMDEPFAFGSLYNGTQACNFSAQEVAQQVAQFVNKAHSAFPGVIVGDIEPLWHGVPEAKYQKWMAAAHDALGSPLPFFQLDVDWTVANWDQSALQLETYANQHGVQFGMIYNSDQNDVTDAAWLSHAEQHIVTFEAKDGGRPGQVIFQSWDDKPDYSLPDSQNGTFTHLILRYFRTRTSLTMDATPAGGGSVSVSGALTAKSGASMAGRSLGFYATPVSGSGLEGTYSLTGTVPQGATSALVGFRVNSECGCDGNAQFSLYRAAFSLGGGTNLVPNPDFAAGTSGWGEFGNGSITVQSSDAGGGNMLAVQASPDQYAGINSASFTVTAGSTYTVTFDARVSPGSVGSGYFMVIFLSSSEIGRQTIQLAPLTLKVGTTATGAGGSYSALLQGLPTGSQLQITAKFPGDASYWPALSVAAVSV